ncbi:DUF7093 family protein [Haloarcula marina]|uniref:DUF7093 family protein n=1 Tax=Haloarcula marina TaxID=2961574 RepID=UPI0020B76CD8|nr:hypothetical protein [Halomicroarcula marina]
MGLKCSVLGHTYGETTVEREREEQGSEVVITIQELETCERCGQTRVVSENKEVTSIETPSDIAGDMLDDEADGPPSDDENDDEAAATDDPDEGTDPVDETDDEEADGDASTAGDTAESGVETSAEMVDPDDDDAEILDDSDEDDEEAVTDSELDNPTTHVDVPDAEEEGAAAADDPEEDDALIIDGEEDAGLVDDDREPGAWPEEPAGDEDDWRPETVLGGDGDAAAEAESGESAAVTVPDDQFYCPECEFTTDIEASSLRAGDFCPECHKGSLVTNTE